MKIDIHSHNPSSLENDSIHIYCHANYKERLPQDLNHFCVGLHPWFLPENPEEKKEAFSFLEHNLKEKNFFGLGECGLDRLKGPAIEIQEELLRDQLKLAEKYHIPRVILHCVRAYPDLQKIINKGHYSGFLIFHDYGANKDITHQLLQNSKIYFSLGRALSREKFTYEVLPLLPKERVFLETDDDNISIKERYQQLAKLWKMTVVELESCITSNYHQIVK